MFFPVCRGSDSWLAVGYGWAGGFASPVGCISNKLLDAFGFFLEV